MSTEGIIFTDETMVRGAIVAGAPDATCHGIRLNVTTVTVQYVRESGSPWGIKDVELGGDVAELPEHLAAYADQTIEGKITYAGPNNPQARDLQAFAMITGAPSPNTWDKLPGWARAWALAGMPIGDEK